MGTTEAGRYDTKKSKREETNEGHREQKPASEILMLTELCKQMLLLGNRGRLLETRNVFCHQQRGRESI